MVDIEVQIQKDLDTVVKNVAEWVRAELMDEIEVHVYQWGETQKRKAETQYGQESAYYILNDSKPTYQFLNSIVCDPLLDSAIRGFVGYQVMSDPELMDLDGTNYLHGTWSTAASRDAVTTIIFPLPPMAGRVFSRKVSTMSCAFSCRL